MGGGEGSGSSSGGSGFLADRRRGLGRSGTDGNPHGNIRHRRGSTGSGSIFVAPCVPTMPVNPFVSQPIIFSYTGFGSLLTCRAVFFFLLCLVLKITILLLPVVHALREIKSFAVWPVTSDCTSIIAA